MFRTLPALFVGVTIAVPVHTALAHERNRTDTTADHSEALGLDVRSRIALARRLAVSHTVAFPDIREALVTMALNDASEPVRYEAVLALQMALVRHAEGPGPVSAQCCRSVPTRAGCLLRPQGLIRRLLSRVFGSHRDRSVIALTTEPVAFSDSRVDRPPCDLATRDALSVIVNGCDEQGRFREPSPRVRTAAAAALSLCGTEPNAMPDSDGVPPLPSGERGDGAKEPEIEEPPAESLGFEPLAAIRDARRFAP